MANNDLLVWYKAVVRGGSGQVVQPAKRWVLQGNSTIKCISEPSAEF